jgi:hypothetical protein
MLILMWQLVGSGDDRIHGALRMDMSWSEGDVSCVPGRQDPVVELVRARLEKARSV